MVMKKLTQQQMLASKKLDVVDHLKDMRDKGIITNEQCVSLATASVGIPLGKKGVAGANVHDWRRGESAMGGGLVAGSYFNIFRSTGKDV